MKTNPSAEISSSSLVQKTIAFWEDRSGKPVSEEDAREMIESIVVFYSLLSKWEAAEVAGLENQKH